MSSQLQLLLSGLLQPDLTRRLGCLMSGVADVKQHAWFNETDWMAIYHKEVGLQNNYVYVYRYRLTLTIDYG